MSRGVQKELTRQKILEASVRVFKKSGFSGTGVDGLAKEAGVTSGAFYVHFSSKAHAFHEALSDGLAGLTSALIKIQSEKSKTWWVDFVRFYLTEKRTCDLADGCVLQTLAGDVARADIDSKLIFEQGLKKVVQIIVDGPAAPDKPENKEAAYAALMTMLGVVSVSRALLDKPLKDSMAELAIKNLCPSIQPKSSKSSF